MAAGDLDLELVQATARRAVEAASRVSLAYFRSGFSVELKADRSPVTAADRDSEDAIIAVIRASYPNHLIVGEETGTHGGNGGSDVTTRWIIDPLDGTRGFTRGETFWGPLVALEYENDIVAGAMALPLMNRIYFATRGRGAWRSDSSHQLQPLRVSTVAHWRDATLSLGEPGVLLAPPLLDPVVHLATTCARTRCYGDLAGFAMVLDGRAEAWIEAGVQIWDLAPMKILIEEAGGRFTDLTGQPTISSGNCIVTNGAVHDHVLDSFGSCTPRDA